MWVFEWDVEDRLVVWEDGVRRSEFSYDGQGRRVRIVEKENGAVITDRRYVWCGQTICQERDTTGTQLLKEYFSNGVDDYALGSFYYTRDHLGSIREVTSPQSPGGAPAALVTRYDYDPYGTRFRITGTLDFDFGFTGHYIHHTTGLALAPYRAYDAGLGRWLSEDPAGIDWVGNLYAYVRNGPIEFRDPSGLVELRWLVTATFGDPDTACPRRRPAGACSRVGGGATGTCEEVAPCQFKAKTVLYVQGTITVWPGPFPYKGRRPLDPFVVDWWSAYVHEFDAHIIPAVVAATAILTALEARTFTRRSDCERELRRAIGRANSAFRTALKRNPT